MGSVRDRHAGGTAAAPASTTPTCCRPTTDCRPPYVRRHAVRRELACPDRAGTGPPGLLRLRSTGAGVEALIAGIAELLPSSEGDGDGPVSGTVFKVERGPAGEKITYVRMFSGALHVRDRVALNGGEAKVTAIRSSKGERRPSAGRSSAGQIAKVWGLAPARIGDIVGTRTGRPASPTTSPRRRWRRSSTRAGPRTGGALHAALTQLAEQDPLIGLRQDDVRKEISVSLYGEVQKEVIQATLADEYDVDVTFRETTTICVERLVGSGAAFELIGKESNPFLATVGLRVDPAPVDSGVAFRLEVELGSMPPAFFTAVEQTVVETLRQGLHGWEVSDCIVTMTHSGYWARQSHSHGTFDASMSSTAGDFRNLTPLVLMTALQRAGTRVHEPIHRFELEIPADTLGPTLTGVAQLRGVPLNVEPVHSSYVVTGEIAAARVNDLQQVLPRLTHGEGVLISSFERYAPVQGEIPERPRMDHNPLDRARLSASGRPLRAAPTYRRCRRSGRWSRRRPTPADLRGRPRPVRRPGRSGPAPYPAQR